MCGVCGALERERARCMVEAVTFVKLSGGASIHAHEWLLLQPNTGLYVLYFSYRSITFHVLFFIIKIIHDNLNE